MDLLIEECLHLFFIKRWGWECFIFWSFRPYFAARPQVYIRYTYMYFFLTKNLNKYRGKCGRGYPVYRSLYRTSITKRMQIFFLGKMNSISISDIFILSCSFLYLACAFIFPSQWSLKRRYRRTVSTKYKKNSI